MLLPGRRVVQDPGGEGEGRVLDADEVRGNSTIGAVTETGNGESVIIKIKDIVIPESIPHPTQEQIEDMRGSITEHGLINPITVRSLNGTQYELVAGRVRLEALRFLQEGPILSEDDEPVINAEIKDLTDEQARETRLHENLKRSHLPWYEEVTLKQQLHSIRQDEHGAANPKGGQPKKDEGKKGWSLRDTAEELGESLGTISQDLNLAEAVKLNPSLRNVKDKRTAMKLVKREARRVSSELESGVQVYSIEVNQVLLGAADTVLATIPPNTFDGCITDPPWLKFHQSGDSPHLVKDAETWPVFVQLFRTLKPNSFLYAFVGFEDWSWYRAELPKLGFHVSKTPLIWHKRNAMSRVGVAGWEYDRNFELILLAVKGSPSLVSRTQRGSIFDFPVVPTKHLVHPNEKPADLITEIVKDCSYPGSLIVDPFGGSGVVAEVAKKEDRVYFTIERDPVFYQKIVERLSAKKADPKKV